MRQYASLLSIAMAVGFLAVPSFGQGSVQLDGTNDYVSMGAATSALGRSVLTLECWFRRDGAGVQTSTGTGGLTTAVPLITKGRGEAETPANLNANYFLGLSVSGGNYFLAADFEDTATGLNHPIVGTTAIGTGTWTHAAATYDGTTWRLYLNGNAEATLVVGGFTPEATSIQHFGIGTAMTSTGAAAGFFMGLIDEVRVWEVARSPAEIAANWNLPLTSGTGLIGRWGLNERGGLEALDSAGATRELGTLTGGALFSSTGATALASAGETTVTFQQGVNSYTSSVDTTLVQAAAGAGTAQNGLATLTVDGTTPPSGTDGQHILIRFDNIQGVAPGQIPAGATIHSASLTLNVTNVTANPPNLHRMILDWAAGATWNSLVGGVQPDGVEAAVVADATPSNLGTGTAPVLRSVDVTTSLAVWQGGSPNYGWAWLPSGTDGLVFDSAEGATAANHPRLAITYVVGGNTPPNQPTLVSPANGANGVSTSPNLTVNVTDPDSNPMTVTFYGREVTAVMEDFTIVVLPDTQYYSQTYPGLYLAQLEWIRDNRVARNIVFVTQLGDCVNNQDDAGQEYQWTNASAAWDIIEDPGSTGLPEGIPYGIAVGNHDNGGNPRSGANEGATTVQYTKHFGLQRVCPGTCSNNPVQACEKDADCVSPGICNPGVSCKSWFGDSYDFGDPVTYFRNTDNHYELFSASGMDFIAFHLEWDCADGSMGCQSAGVAHPMRQQVINWMDNILTNVYPNRRAMISSHFLLQPSGSPPAFSHQGQAVYDTVKDNPNVFMTLCGHLDQANRRTDTFGGGTIHSMISDYQTRPNGGRGWMRTLTFSPANNTIHVETFSPWVNYPSLPRQIQSINSHGDNTAGTPQNEFVLTYSMAPSFAQIGSPVTGVASGSNASVQWTGLNADASHEWYVTVSDGTATTTGPVWTFLTVCSDDAACDDGNPCTTDVCNLGTSSCENTNNTDACDDGNACTAGDACSGGACAGTPTSAPCSDGLVCTTGDTCSAGVCVGTPVTCTSPATCNPATGQCELTLTFQQNVSGYTGAQDTYLHAGTPDTDYSGAASLTSDLSGGSPAGINQALVKFENFIGASAGQVPQGSIVSSATLTLNVTNNSSNGFRFRRLLQAWDATDTWNDWVGGVQDNNTEAASTIESPDPTILAAGVQVIDVTARVQAWVDSPAANFGWVFLQHLSTDDGLALDSSEAATAANRPKLTVVFNPGAPCTQNSDCDDNDACNGIETCNTGAGFCVNGTPLNCDDTDPCTDDSCIPASGCAHVNNTSSCDDGNACTTGDVCSGGSCNGTPIANCCTTAADCEDGNDCTDDVCSPSSTHSLELNGSTGQVSMGAAPGLNATQLTIECWFQRTGTGVANSTGTGGIAALVPLFGKGAPEADTPLNLNMNYVIGIDTATNTLAVDFEDGATGLNHPASTPATPSSNVIPPTGGGWHHAAATYDGSTWRIYLDGALVHTAVVGAFSPVANSIQHFGLGTMLSSTGAAVGRFQGILDEVRVWNTARSQAQISAGMSAEIASASGLIGRWGLNEGSGSAVADSSGGAANGTASGGFTWRSDTVPPIGGACSFVPIVGCCNTAADCDDTNVCTTDTCDLHVCSHAPVAGCCLTAADCSDGDVCTTDLCGSNRAAIVCDGTNDYVTMGPAPGLGTSILTVEFWFKRTAAGVAASTGGGGIASFIPMVCKGAGQAESPANLNANYLVGINTAGNVLAADFEDTATGLNHPVSGTTAIVTGTWYHAAATYDGTTWRLYLNGNPEATLVVGAFLPEATSIQHFGFCSTLNSTGVAAGFFAGQLDEVRVWNVARTQAQLQADMNQEITSGTGLLGRWGAEEGFGPAAADSTAPAENGTLTNGATWATSSLASIGPPNVCEHGGIANCCYSEPSECDDFNLCTLDSCVANVCSNAPIPGCCITGADCNDNNPCTVDTCASNQCQNTPNVSLCDDADLCTDETCSAGNAAALSFDGTNDNVNLGNAAPIANFGTSSRTIELWMFADTYGAADRVGLFRGGRQGAFSQVAIQLFLSGGISASVEDTALHQVDTATIPISLNQWHHVAAVIDRGLNELRLYVDGSLVATANASVWATNPISSADSVTLGAARDAAGALIAFFDGRLDEVRVWNGVRSLAQIQQTMFAALPAAPGLIARWGLNEGSGGTTTDSVGSLVGTLVNGVAWTTSGLVTLGNCSSTPINVPVVCNDSNVCTDESCIPATGCTHTNNSSACDDSDACTTVDVCASGSCTGSTPLVCNDGNACTTDSCNPASGCAYPNNTNACNDGDACTTGDVCSGGACVGGGPTDCSDGNVCTTDTCESPTGCEHANNTVSCDDGNACTTGDTCSGGACQSGSAVVCNDGNVCTTDSCVPATGCLYTNNSDPCNDNDACTTVDVCASGSCTGSVPPDCDDLNVCTADSCHPASGCEHDGTGVTGPCDDGGSCTVNDLCQGDPAGTCLGTFTPGCQPCVIDSDCDDESVCTGIETCVDDVCVAGTPLVCVDGNGCTDDGCDADTGCFYTNNSAPCSDGSACTLNDACSGGACVGGPAPNCNDGNACTDDDCSPASGCTHVNNTASCDDGDACTTGDTCAGGTCVGGAAPNCDDLNVCTDDGCHPATGCTHSNNSSTCSDGSACTTGDVCISGTCQGTAIPGCTECTTPANCPQPVNTCASLLFTPADTCQGGICVQGTPVLCSDGNECTTDSCSVVSGCGFTNNTAPCDDGDACTTVDTCSSGACVGGAPPNCNDSDVCTDDGCNSATGCTHTNNTASCSDSSACTINDTCSGGLCVGGPAPNCDDSNGCTDDGCNPATGCTHSNNTSSCNDGDACTTGDTCAGGACVGGPAPNCDDANVCTNDGCNPATGCTHTNNTASCSDGDACTTGDTCAGGACVGGPAPNCDDANACTNDGCNPATGCTHTNNTSSCNDNNACTTGDVCSGGSCVGGPAPDCNDGNVCTTDTCIPASGCSNVNNTQPCSDGSACTTNDACAGGSCVGGAPPNCDDGNVCTTDSCSPASGCAHANNTQSCTDGNACTGSDACSGGSCQGGPAPDCDDGNVCTADSCNPSVGCQHSNVADGTSCDDGLFCNGVALCQAGVCQAGAPDCTDVCEPCDEGADACEWCVLDLDQNGGMGTGDFAFFAGCFGACYAPLHPCAVTNFDGDPNNCCGTGDFGGFAGCFGQTCSECGNCHPVLSRPSDGPAALALHGDVTVVLVAVMTPSVSDQADAPPSPVESVRVNQQFHIEVWANDRAESANNDGVAGIYVDLTFAADRIRIDGVRIGDAFATLSRGTVVPTDGLVRALGGCVSPAHPPERESDWLRVATLEARALSVGTTTINVGSSSAPYGISMLGRFGDVPVDTLSFGPLELMVRSSRATPLPPKTPDANRTLRGTE